MSRDAVEQIKARLNVVDVVGAYVTLQKAGKNYKAKSPFTSERTPSFFVSPDQGLYYCFSSGKGGDMFTFVQEMEGVDFMGALKILAEKAGVELKKENMAVRGERDILYAVLETATRFYEAQVPKQEKVIEYLKKRGMTGVSAKTFRVGYALEDWNALHDHLVSKGFSVQVMEKAGLVIRGEKKYYDRFRGRVMFPIANSAGQIVAFSGRVFHISGETEEKTAKYVNSPETELYNKSEILYGFDKAKQEIRKTNTCILVEGQMDLVLSHQAGVTNTVAVSGTALSEFHLGFIHRIAENLIIAFDADSAGISAAGRGIGLALSEGFEVSMVALPLGKDPADVIREDPEIWKEAVSKAKHVVDFYIEYCVAKEGGPAVVRKNIEAYVLPYIARLSSEIDKAQFVAKIAEILHISESPIWEEIHKINIAPSSDKKDVPPLVRPTTRRRNIEEKIIGIILSEQGTKESSVDVAVAKKRFEDITGRGFENEAEFDGSEKGRLIFEAEAYCNKERTAQSCLDGLFNGLKQEALREKVTLLRSELSKKDRGERTEEELLKNIQEMQREIEALGKDENSS